MSKDLDSYLCARCKRTGYIGDGGHGCYPSANLVQPASASPDILSIARGIIGARIDTEHRGSAMIARSFTFTDAQLTSYTERIRSEQRERDALICDRLIPSPPTPEYIDHIRGITCKELAASIRAGRTA